MKRISQIIVTFSLALLLIYSPVLAQSNVIHETDPVLPKSHAKQIKLLKPITNIDTTPIAVLEPIYIEPAVVVAKTAPEGTGNVSEWLYKLRMCESGGNYATNTGNSFYGAYQFTIDTWNSLGTAYSRADLAPPDIQDQAIITNTNRSAGGLVTQNPGCYAKEGLSAFPST